MTSTIEPMINAKDAAEHLGVKETTLAVWRCRGDGPQYYKVGRCVRYRVTDLDGYKKTPQQKPQRKAPTNEAIELSLCLKICGLLQKGQRNTDVMQELKVNQEQINTARYLAIKSGVAIDMPDLLAALDKQSDVW